MSSIREQIVHDYFSLRKPIRQKILQDFKLMELPEAMENRIIDHVIDQAQDNETFDELADALHKATKQKTSYMTENEIDEIESWFWVEHAAGCKEDWASWFQNDPAVEIPRFFDELRKMRAEFLGIPLKHDMTEPWYQRAEKLYDEKQRE